MMKKKVGVLRGGPSSEYEVSLKSGHSVLKHLPEKYTTKDIFISKDGLWHMDGIVRPPEKILNSVDVIFNALHGEYGEDGQVQQLLQSHKIPFTGSDALASAFAMNKHLTKKAVEAQGIKTPNYFLIKANLESPHEIARRIFNTFGPPYVVKPVGLGSSVGVSIVRTIHDLPNVLEHSLSFTPTVLIEECILGKEATCGVIDQFRGESAYALLPIEIRFPKNFSFFDYQAKYSGLSEEICPGNFTREEKEIIQGIATDVHRLLGLRHYSRSDFIVSPRRGIYFLEVNTLPGLTSESLMPKALSAVGTNLSDFFDHVVTLAMNE